MSFELMTVYYSGGIREVDAYVHHTTYYCSSTVDDRGFTREAIGSEKLYHITEAQKHLFMSDCNEQVVAEFLSWVLSSLQTIIGSYFLYLHTYETASRFIADVPGSRLPRAVHTMVIGDRWGPV
jgi:hypothetical protein